MYHIDEQEAIRLYKAGKSITQIAKMLDVTHTVIRKRLVDNGLELRTTSEIASLRYRTNPHVRTRLLQTRVKYPLNEIFFDTLTPDSSYVLGFIQADGNVDTKRARLRITLKPSDADFLTRIAQRMGTERPLIDAKSPYGKGVYLGIYSKAIVTALQCWGIQNPKTHTASTHPMLLLNRDYWRGVIDGDGTLYVTPKGQKILSLVGSQALCTEFLAFCRFHDCGQGVSVIHHKNIFCVRINSSEAVKIATVLYEKADLALDRKVSIYATYFKETQPVPQSTLFE